MLQTELATNSTNNTAVNSVLAKTDKQADIVKRLEELSKWQEEQKKLLEARQTMQRQMLGMEQQTMYQMLGLQSSSELSVLEDIEKVVREERFLTNQAENLEEYEDQSTEESLETSQLEGEEESDESEQLKDVEPASFKTLTSGYETEHGLEVPQNKPKRPFLKRGEGLKQRFKIDPNEFRLNNLPKYKYANAHPTLSLKPSNKLNKVKEINTKALKQVNFTNKNTKSVVKLAALDAQEQRFQNLLISSQNTCSSTPDTKLSYAANKKLTATTNNAAKVKFLEDKSNIPLKIQDDGPKTQTVIGPVVAWSKILDPLEIEPLQVPRNRIQSLPHTEESIFELLEQKAINGSFDMDSTCLKQFMQRRITEKLNETDDNIPVQEELRNKRLEPVVLTKKAEEQYSNSSEDVEEEESQLTEQVETTESDDTTHKTIETTNSSYPQHTPQVRVRFSDSNETHEYEEEPESTLNDSSRLSAGATEQDGQGDNSNNEMFEQFKHALFAALQIKADQHLANDTTINSSDTTLTPKDSISVTNNNNNNSIYSPACQDLQQKTDMIKIRLAELEKEIQNFKDNNVLLMKAKQEHELQKSLHAQEHLEAMERVKDEKIQMEIYLHDERVKLEDEKRLFEQNMKMKTQGSIAKERKECERLREQVSQLEMQLKSKDANHTSAQARLRTQIRNLEREQNKLHEQIEHLLRENKRLENENLKISREQNNKILLEINRNIAKLAPKQIQHSSTSMPEEGPPTLGASRTVSKCIVAAATANKNAGKAYKTTSTRYSNSKLVTNKKSTPPSSPEPDRTTENRFKPEKQPQQHQQQSTKYFTDPDDDEDMLKEFQMTPAKSNSNANKSLHPTQEPQPPPPSPRATAAQHNDTTTNNLKREIVNADGSKDIWYPNGNLKKISADGMVIRMLYYNKDIKETNINEGTVKYYYAETNTWHTTYLDGLEILEFPNGQVEHRHKTGVVEVHYPNNSVKIMDPKDEHKQEEWRFVDGTHLVQMRNGDKILSLPNGQKEIHNKLHKRREYPDGTVKIVYPDGSTETRYSNGRVRLKDKEGKLVMDTDMAK
ncbi:centromere protein J [Calliphora vicina]|uniref:centromere protein J n=1 Tax=Calliphora vicina TaxID=7373 RepID=UPI00325A685E